MLPDTEAFFIFADMQQVAFIINPFSARKNYHPFLNELKKKVENPNFYISAVSYTHLTLPTKRIV